MYSLLSKSNNSFELTQLHELEYNKMYSPSELQIKDSSFGKKNSCILDGKYKITSPNSYAKITHKSFTDAKC